MVLGGGASRANERNRRACLPHAAAQTHLALQIRNGILPEGRVSFHRRMRDGKARFAVTVMWFGLAWGAALVWLTNVGATSGRTLWPCECQAMPLANRSSPPPFLSFSLDLGQLRPRGSGAWVSAWLLSRGPMLRRPDCSEARSLAAGVCS